MPLVVSLLTAVAFAADPTPTPAAGAPDVPSTPAPAPEAPAARAASGPMLVIHANPDSRVALGQAAAALGRKSDSLNPVTVADLVVGKPAVLRGPGRAEACATPTGTTAAIQLGVDRAERAIDYLEFEKALGNLQVAAQAVGCLAEPLDRDLASRAYFLLGYAFGQQGDTALARDAFVRAVALKPGLGWDKNLPPDLEPLFKESVASLKGPSVRVAFTPLPTAGQVYVDGVAVADPALGFELAPGTHLVQVLGLRPTVAWVHVRPNAPSGSTAQLVLPGLVPVEAAAWAGTPARRAELGALLATLLDRDETVVVLTDGVAWTHTVGTETWTEKKVPAGAMGGGFDRAALGRSLTWAGGAVALGGAAMSIEGWLASGSAARAGESAGDYAAYLGAEQEYAGAKGRLQAGWLVTGGGLLLLGGGLGMSLLSEGGPGVVVLPGGLGLAGRW